MWEKAAPQWMPSVRDLCQRPYYNHPNGCPNYTKRDTCPPRCPFWSDVFHLATPSYAIWNVFNLAEHIEKMRQKHPLWSKRQLYCCLWWQPKARKQLKIEIAEFQKVHPQYTVVTNPEAMGINITATMKRIGINLPWPPVDIAYQIALAGLTWEQGSKFLLERSRNGKTTDKKFG